MNSEVVLLRELINLRRGLSWDHAEERQAPEAGTYPVLRIPNIKEKLVLDDILHLKPVNRLRAEQFEVSPGTILLVGSNGNPARVGNAVYYDGETDFLYASFLMAANVIEENNADSKFLFHFLSSPHVQDVITRSVQGSTGLKNLSEDTIYSLRIPSLPLPEQRKIAAILDTVDEAIRQTERVLEKLKAMKQGLLHDLLTRGIDENGELRPPPHEAPHLYKDSPLGKIPNEWSAAQLGHYFKVQSGFAFSSTNFADRGCRLIRIGNITEQKLRFDNSTVYLPTHFLDSKLDFQAKPGDIVIAMSGATTGKVAMVDKSDLPALINQRVGRFSNRDKSSYYLPLLLFHIMQTDRFLKEVVIDAIGGAQPNISSRKIESFLIPVPAIEEQNRVIQIVDSCQNRFFQESTCLEIHQQLKRGLMDDLLTGRVRVAVDDEGAA